MRPRTVLPALAALLPAALAAQQPPQTFDWWTSRPIPAATAWGEPVDTASTRLIRSWTTMPEYTTPLVDWLPASPTVVSPTRHFGHPVGKPGVLHRVDELYGYYQALAASTPRVRFQRLGETEEGNRLALVQVGSERNLGRLEEIRAGLARLADPRGTDSAEARRLVDALPVVYTLYGGLHSAETGPPEMLMELAYRLAVSDDPLVRTVRDSVVVFIVPVAEPDGRNRVVDWLRRHGRDVFDEDDRLGPPYWGRYIFHDNNRDGLQLSARLTQELVKLFLDWHYPVGHDLHESVPYLYTSTGTGPYNPTVDPITVGEWQWLANFEVTALTAHGMPGVWTHGFYDGWYPGYLLWVTNTRNAMGRFYETFGSSNPNTMKRTVREQTSVEWYRPSPPRAETLWSLRNNTNYMETGVLHALHLVAQNRRRVLEQFWTKSNNAVRRGRTEKPYAWVVPAAQPRRADAAYMLNLLRRQGIELHRATTDAKYGDVQVRRGDYVVRMDQPYRNFVQTLMEVQRFPADAPAPYDDVAWTFPLMFNVEARAVDDAAVQRLAMEPVRDSVRVPGSAVRGGAWYLVDPRASAHSLSARLALRDVRVEALEDSLRAAGRAWAPGTWVVPASAGDARVAGWVRDFGLEAVGVGDPALRGAARHELDLPRVAVLHTWRYTQDDGWTRYALDRMGLPYTYLGEDRLRQGRLRERFDVILFPAQGSRATGRTIFAGIDPRFGRLDYVKSDSFPALGSPDSTRDVTGGMGFEGLAALRDFVEAGGTLVALGSASGLPVEMGLVRDVSTSQPRNLFVPGSIVRGRVAQAKSPITYGYDAAMPLYHQFGPYFTLPDRVKGRAVLRYAKADSVSLSGLVRAPNELAEQPAAVVVPAGRGTVVLFGFDPLHRFQNHGNFAFVWNALLNWNDLRVGLPAPGRAAAATDDDLTIH
ncbi:MAG TPA: M14 family zinc carboxypeptidase [Longimicrobium sp.]|jgi:hypothetical protein